MLQGSVKVHHAGRLGPSGGPVRVDVNAFSANCTASVDPAAECVEVSIRTDGEPSGPAGVAVKGARVTQRGNALTVTVPSFGEGGRSSGVVCVDVTLPALSSMSFSGSTGTVRSFGALDVVRVRSRSSFVQIEEAHKADIRCVSGESHIGVVHEAVSVEHLSGLVRIEHHLGSALKIVTDNGEVFVNVDGKATGVVDIKSANAPITVDGIVGRKAITDRISSGNGRVIRR